MTNRWLYPFLIGCALRIGLPWYGHGFRYMDEHWQVMEPANYLVHGVWSQTVEWVEGLRSWIYPWFVSLQIRTAEALGLREPIWITAFVRSIHGLIASFSIPIVYLAVARLTRQYGEKFAWAAAWLVAIWPYAVYCGFHTHGEMFGALFVLGAVAAPVFLAEKLGYVISGALFGVALAVKIDVAVAGLAYGVWQLVQGRLRRALLLALGVAPFVLLVGAVDYLTWGKWFQNVLGHAHANLVEEVGNQWGVSPWYMHVVYFFDITGAATLAAALFVPFTWRTLPEPLRATWFVNFFFIAVFAAIDHKEKRFMAPLVYTGQLAAFATLACAFSKFRTRAFLIKFTGVAVATLLAVHFSANVVTYWIKRPWWNRISAMRQAGQIPGIEKMLSPQWPAVFYLPRHIPAEVVGADGVSLLEKTRGLTSIGVATDWKSLHAFENLGFECSPWPAPPLASPDPTPWAHHCVRTPNR